MRVYLKSVIPKLVVFPFTPFFGYDSARSPNSSSSTSLTHCGGMGFTWFCKPWRPPFKKKRGFLIGKKMKKESVEGVMVL